MHSDTIIRNRQNLARQLGKGRRGGSSKTEGERTECVCVREREEREREKEKREGWLSTMPFCLFTTR